MLWLVLRRSGDLLRFEFGAPLVPDDSPERLVRWYLEDGEARFEELFEIVPADVREAVSGLLPELRDDPRRLVPALRALAVWARPDDHPLVEPLLAHPDATVRRAAIRAIGRLGDSPRYACLLPFLDDPDAATRHDAVTALGKLGIEEVAPKLDAAAERDPALGPAVRIAERRIDAIQRRDFPALLEAVLAAREWDDLLALMLFLKRFLRELAAERSRSEEERSHAVWSLGLWRIRRASWPIQKILADPTESPRLRLEAVRAIGRARLASAVDDLIALASDAGAAAEMREEAALALGRIGRTRAFEPLVAQWDVAGPALRQALRLGLRKMARPAGGLDLAALLAEAPLDAERVIRIGDDLVLYPGADVAEIRSHLGSALPAARRDAILLAGAFGTSRDSAALAPITRDDPDPLLRELATEMQAHTSRRAAPDG